MDTHAFPSMVPCLRMARLLYPTEPPPSIDKDQIHSDKTGKHAGSANLLQKSNIKYDIYFQK